MTDYKAYFDNFVDDFYKNFDKQSKESVQVITVNYNNIDQKLSNISDALNKLISEKPIDIIDNAQFIKLMGISQKTAQTWRDNGTISFSQVNNKIYYRKSDIIDLLDRFYVKSPKALSHEK